MRLYYALYDPASPESGRYWSWAAPEIPAKCRESFYYDTACKHRPPNPNALAVKDIWGGFARLDQNWIVVYRFLNGGNDQRGRPGRFVIATVWLAAGDAEQMDLSGLLELSFFTSLAEKAPTSRPIPAPERLADTWRGTPADPDATTDIASVIAAGSRTFTGSEAIVHAASLFAHIPPQRKAQVRIVHDKTQCSATVELHKPETIATPPQWQESAAATPQQIHIVNRVASPPGFSLKPRHIAAALTVLVAAIALGVVFLAVRNLAETPFKPSDRLTEAKKVSDELTIRELYELQKYVTDKLMDDHIKKAPLNMKPDERVLRFPSAATREQSNVNTSEIAQPHSAETNQE